MTDVLTPAQRRLNMSRIRGKDTKPEMLIRRALHARGLRYRLHPKNIAGKPDMVFARHRAVILVQGCFWHGHDCPLFKWPATRTEFWRKKIEGNRERDRRQIDSLSACGWRVLLIWECALRGKHKRSLTEVLDKAEHFIRQEHPAFCTISHLPDNPEGLGFGDGSG